MRKFVSDHISGGESQVPVAKWQLVLDWCLAAAQGNNDGTRILNLGAPEWALCQDAEFLEWCKLRVATTLGQGPQQAAHHYNGGRPGNLAIGLPAPSQRYSTIKRKRCADSDLRRKKQ